MFWIIVVATLYVLGAALAWAHIGHVNDTTLHEAPFGSGWKDAAWIAAWPLLALVLLGERIADR